MRRTFLAKITTLAVLGSASAVFAGDFFARMKGDWHRNNMWPQPFVLADRAAVCEYFAIQTNNGWKLQTTIGDAYFDEATQELTVAGQHKVKWIVQQAPLSRRNVYVLVNENEEVTNARVASVQQAVTRYNIKGAPAEVFLTDRDIAGGSGEYYDAVDRAMKSSVPAPRLPAAGAGGGAGAAGAGAGGGGAAGS